MKTPPWLYLAQVTPGAARLDAETSHHTAHVLRLRQGDLVVVFDGRGARANATVGDHDRKGLSVQVGEVVNDPPARPAVWLGTAIPKGKRWPWLVEKVTEAGVDIIQPVHFARGVAKGEGRPEKWRAWALR